MEKLGTQPTDFKVMDIVLFCIFGIISFPCTAATTNCYVEEGKAYRGPPNQSFRNVESYESCRSLCSFGPDIPYFVWRGPNSPNPNSRLDCNCKMNRDTIEDVGGIYSGNTKCTNGKLLTGMKQWLDRAPIQYAFGWSTEASIEMPIERKALYQLFPLHPWWEIQTVLLNWKAFERDF